MKRLLYLFVLLLSLSLWSCGSKDDGIDDPDVPENPEQPENPDVPEYVELYVSEDNLVMEAQGGEASFDIECNTKWSIRNESGWCKTDVASGEGNGTVKVTAGAYHENADRNTVLTVKAGDEARTIQVTQKHENALIPSKTKFDVGQEGGNISIELPGNIDCRLTIPWRFKAWIKEAPKSKESETKTFDLVISKNDKFEKREGYVIVSGDALEDTVRIYQAQTDLLILTQSVYRLQVEGGDITVELKTNVDYEITIPGDATSWISHVETRAIREDRLVFHIEANGNDKERTAKIVVKDKNSALDDTLYVQQYWKGSHVGNVVLETTEDVQAFAARGIKKLMGSLIVQGSNLSSLTALNGKLEEISDDLIIDCSSLTSFDGLHGLKRIGGDLIIRNGRFAFFEGVYNLEYIGGSFRISSLMSLKNFSGLGSLSEIGGDFEISSLRSLENFVGLYNLGEIGGDFEVSSLMSLENFVGLDNLGWIGGSFRITSSYSLGSLQNFSGLGNLVEIGHDFEVSSSSSSLGSLENFVGLDNLCRIGGSFRITSDYSLKSLQNFSGLGSLSEIGGDFEISSSKSSKSSESLESLENFVGLDNLGRIGGSFRITSSCSSDLYSLRRLQNFSGLGSLSEIGGDFEISSSAYGSSLESLENFVGLDNLGRIGGSFRITSSPSSSSSRSLESLQNFSGLGSLTEIVGDFEVSSSAADAYSYSSISLSSLENFVGLDNLSRIGGSFRITSDYYSLGSLQNFVGLGSLSKIGGDFFSNKSLSVLTVLEKLETVGGKMHVRLGESEDAHFTALQSVGGALSLSSFVVNVYLPALKTVGGAFSLRNFKSVDIPKLESIEGAFTITGVNAIGTLDKLKTVGDITIKDCRGLTDFCNWKPVLTDYNGTFSVSDCGYNPTKYQILNGACSKLPEE